MDNSVTIPKDEMEILTAYSKLSDKYDLKKCKWYGGAYLDEDKKLHFQVTKNNSWSYVRDDILESFNQDVIIETVDKSYPELMYEYNKISCSKDDNILGVGISECDNCISLAVKNKSVKTGVSDCYVFEIGDISLHVSVDIGSNLSNSMCSFSLGYPAVSESGDAYGFITAGHISTYNNEDELIYYYSTPVGTVSKYEYSDEMDAAFVKLYQGNSINNNFSIEDGCALSGMSPTLIQGASVLMYGGASGKIWSGRLVYPEFDLLGHKKTMVFSYLSKNGDSGSPVILKTGDGKAYLVGIHLGTFNVKEKFYSFGYSASDINKKFSLKLNI